MRTWTAGAKAELERYLAAIRRPLEQAGADAVEVIEDLKRHIEADIAASQLRVVTVTDLRPMLARFGQPVDTGMSAFTALGVTDALAAQHLEEAPPAPVKPPGRPKPGIGLLVAGVIYPALVFLLEWATGFCAKHFFNPLPTWGHALLVALVPAANGLLWWALRNNEERRLARVVGWGSAASLGISVVYSAVFLPLFFPALIALIYFGLGLLPLTPLISAGATGALRSRLKESLGKNQVPSAWLGIGIAALAFLLVDIRHISSTIALHKVAAAEHDRGAINWLRNWGDETTLLRACRPNPANFSNLAPWLCLMLPKEYQVTPEQAQRVYFQVYGRAYNSAPAPAARAAWIPTPDIFNERGRDLERGGTKVGSPVPGLSLRTSRIDATVEPNAALSYFEWIFEFRNDSAVQAEARSEILLPPNAAVSRLTLWVNGEEREAAFAGRAQVRQAYENVVATRRDPVLVTSPGRDSILMQCFPVPPNSGMMKVRLGVTVPLQLDEKKNGILRWPILRERNFALAEKLEHTFWLDSRQPVQSLGLPLKIEQTKSGHFMAHGNLRAESGEILQPAVKILRDGLPDSAWVRDPRARDGSYVLQTIRASETPPPSDIALVLDGSAALQAKVEGLKSLRVPGEFRLVIAGDTVREFTIKNSQDWARVLDTASFAGGQDNIPALERGWELAAQRGSGTLIWLHGAQPIALSGMEGLKQKFERRRNAVKLLDVPVEHGPNVILPLLPSVARWESASLHQPVQDLLSQMLLSWSGQAQRYEAVRQRSSSPPDGAQSDAHLARAWASDEIKRLAAADRRDEAVRIAGLYQLVSEVSGAVVLETAEQFQRAGLQPVNPATVPVVPEPAAWLLIAFGGALFLGKKKFSRQSVPE